MTDVTVPIELALELPGQSTAMHTDKKTELNSLVLYWRQFRQNQILHFRGKNISVSVQYSHWWDWQSVALWFLRCFEWFLARCCYSCYSVLDGHLLVQVNSLLYSALQIWLSFVFQWMSTGIVLPVLTKSDHLRHTTVSCIISSSKGLGLDTLQIYTQAIVIITMRKKLSWWLPSSCYTCVWVQFNRIYLK